MIQAEGRANARAQSQLCTVLEEQEVGQYTWMVVAISEREAGIRSHGAMQSGLRSLGFILNPMGIH
jgi:hypothetical protein